MLIPSRARIMLALHHKQSAIAVNLRPSGRPPNLDTFIFLFKENTLIFPTPSPFFGSALVA